MAKYDECVTVLFAVLATITIMPCIIYIHILSVKVIMHSIVSVCARISSVQHRVFRAMSASAY